MNHSQFHELAEAVIKTELSAIEALLTRIDGSFSKACEMLLKCKGRIVVTGMGKSGHVARKIAATFSSTGSPAFFLHPGEANHGDLGMITKQDVVVAISYSGTNEEILMFVPLLKRLNVPLISLTGHLNSPLAQQSDVVLDVSVEKEACPLNLAPTASTTTALVTGDALAIALLEAKGFTKEDFARSHPAGNLGRKLLLRVQDIMVTGDAIPKVNEKVNLIDALLEMSEKTLGMTAIVNDNNQVLGLFTDGDLRRTLEKKYDVQTTPITEVMTKNCTTVKPDLLAAEALQLMETRKFNGLLIVDDNNKLVGALNIHTLLRNGII